MAKTPAKKWTPPVWETKVTGRSAKSCTGKTVTGERVKFCLGDRVATTKWRDCGDGGDVCYRAYGTVLEIAVGTEYGMHGTTALCRVAWDGEDTGLVPARLLSHL